MTEKGWPRVKALCPSAAWSKPHEPLHIPGGEPLMKVENGDMLLTLHACKRCGMVFAVCDKPGAIV